MKFKSLLILVASSLAVLPSTVLADSIDNMMKKQCQYNVYGNGTTSNSSSSYLSGIIVGINSMIDSKDRTEFSKKSNPGIISDKACQNALNNISSNGFSNDYLWEAIKLISKKYSK